MVKVSTTDLTPSTCPAPRPCAALGFVRGQGRRGASRRLEQALRAGRRRLERRLLHNARRAPCTPPCPPCPLTGIELESQLVDDVEERIEDTHGKLEPVYGLGNRPGIRLVDPQDYCVQPLSVALFTRHNPIHANVRQSRACGSGKPCGEASDRSALTILILCA
jgi:hypothetical protein